MNELHTAYTIRNALDESTRHLSAQEDQRLDESRKRALAAMPRNMAAQTRPALSQNHRKRGDAPPWFMRFALTAAPLALVAVGAFALLQWSSGERPVETLAELDKAVLLDDLPLSAYADAGFGVFLKHTRQ